MRSRHVTLGAVTWLLGAAVLVASVGDIRVTPIVADRHVAASFTAPASFTEDARAVLQSGLLLTFTFTVDLRRPSGLWWDRTLGSVTVGSTGKFDNLTSVYQVSKFQDGHVFWSDRTMDLSEARGWMTSFERVPLALDDPLEPNADYYIHVRLRASPHRAFSLWPWSADDGAGRAEFTNLR
jgi:hypothetical protein